VVVVGGGIVGCSVAYHLARRGWTDVVLLEQNTLTSGTTWHAAGLVTLARPTHGTTALVKHSLEVFEGLEADTGLHTGFRRTGTLHLAMTDDRWHELRRQASGHRGAGVEVREIDAEAAAGLFPLLRPAGIVGALHYPSDGRGNATDTTMSLARGARMRGVSIHEHIRATGVLRDRARVTGVTTDHGDIECEVVVNCTGMWGREFGRRAGVTVPLQALHHYYVVTEEIAGLPPNMPTIKSSDDFSYVKDDAGTLMVGFFEPGSRPWSPRGIPEGPGFVSLGEDWDHIGPFFERMVERIPILAETGIRLFFAGPESFTPDGFFHFGPVAGVDNYWVAAGFNSIGFLTGPGAGKVLADWIVDGAAPMDLPEVDPRRSMRHQTNRRYLAVRVPETLDLAYDMHWPGLQRSSARGIRRSPVHAHLAAAGACFGELAGWERANWFGDPGSSPVYDYSYGRSAWLERSGQEHRAVRAGVGVFDLSSFGKLLVAGRDAEAVLQRVCANDVGVEPGRIVYTQWLNSAGGIEADVTVSRLAEDRFVVMTAAASVGRDLDHLRRYIGEDFATVTDISAGEAMLAVMGPRSRELLQPLTDADLSHEAFGFGTWAEIDLGYTYVRANRITYVGELGWELMIAADQAVHVYETLVGVGETVGLRHAGYHALNSLRLEKAYRSWGHDIGSTDTPLEAGLGFAVAWDKPGGFVGRDALLARCGNGPPRRRLVQLLLTDPEAILWHDEPVWREGHIVGSVASAGYGWTLGGAVGLAYITAQDPLTQAWLDAATLEVEVAGERVPARASLRPMLDPGNTRVRS